MNEYMRDKGNFVSYEYMDVQVNPRMAQTYMDCYASLGWSYEGESALKPGMPAVPVSGLPSVTLRFKRDRKILNKVELTRLQRNFESCMKEIIALEKSKTLSAQIYAYSVGVVGIGFSVGAVIAFLSSMLLLGVVLAIPGVLGWVLPYFLYLRVSRAKAIHAQPYIDQKYDELYDVCEKGHRLLV